MSALAILWAARYNTGEQLLNRTEAAIAKTVQYILIEDTQTANHAARLAWAESVIRTNSYRTQAESMMWWVVGNLTIAAAIVAGQEVADSDIEYVVGANCHLLGA